MDFPFKGRPIFQGNHRSHHHRHHHHSQSVHSSSPSRQPLLLSASPPPISSLEPIKTSGVILGGGGNGVIINNGPNGSGNGLTLNGNSPGRDELGGGNGNAGSNSLINGKNGPSLLINHSTQSVRKVHLIKEQDDPPDAGLTLCGGLEVGLYGTIYISRVAEDSVAEKAGLCPGDQILSVNYTSFLDSSISCQKALHIICSHDALTLNIFPRSEALNSHRRHAAYHWVDPEGRPVSPPPPDRDLLTSVEGEFDPLLSDPSTGSPSSKINTSPRRRLSVRTGDQSIRTVQIIIEKGINPGLMIRGGLEYGLGIYVTGIESMSAAERGGLKIGDQILFVNNHDFQHVLHDEAVDILRSSPRLTMKVRYVGKIPAANLSLILSSSSSSSTAAQLTSSEGSSGSSTSQTEFPFNRIPSSRCSLPEASHHYRLNRSPCGSQRTSSPGTGSPGYRPISEQGTNHVTPTLLVTESAEEEILEEKLNQLLPEKDRITFAFYRNEYETKGMTVDAFIALFLELLDTREKYSLLNHFRIIIREEDLDKFDELIFKREEQAMIKSKANPIDSAHMIAGDDEELSENSISYTQEPPSSSSSMGNGHHHGHPLGHHHGDHHSYHSYRHHSHQTDSLHTKSTKINSMPIERNLSRNGNVSVRFRPEIDSLSPVSFTKDQPIPRRHSSCNPEIKSTSNCNDFLEVPVNLDERRWSIAAAHDLPSHKYNKGSIYEYDDSLRKRSLIGVEMKTINPADDRDNHCMNSSHHGGNSNLYRNGEEGHRNEDDCLVGVDDKGHHHGVSSVNNHRSSSPHHLQHHHVHHPPSSSSNYPLSVYQSRVRRHSSLPGPGSFNPFGQSTPSASPFHYQPHRSSSFRIPYHRSVREPDGRLRVIVKKSKPILGLAIEGGSDVPSQLQPRIISIHSSGAAFDTGDLHVGHIILEVDGQSTANLSHEQVAQMMAMAYYNSHHKDHIEFVVREKSKNEFDIRRSSFMLLNNSFE